MKITEKQLINSLKQMKEIKPRKEWVFSLKSQILSEPAFAKGFGEAKQISILDILSSVFFQRKLAYAFAVVLFLVVGVFGFATYTVPGDLLFPVKKIAEQSKAALTAQPELKQNVADLKTKISELAKNLNANSLKDPQTAKEVADEVQKIKQLQTKTFADVQGTADEKSLNDALASVNNVLAPLVQNEINDLQKTTLTDDQKNALAQAEDLYSQGKYTDALEKILLINK